MKKILVGFIIAFSMLNASVKAKGTYPACEKEETYKEFVSVVMSVGFQQGYNLFKNKGCTVIFAEQPLNVIERNWSTAKVVFTDSSNQQTVMMFTAIEAVR